jgi:hypothetical protein
MLRHAAAFVIYAALTIAMTWPLATRLSRVVPGDLGDPLLSIWTLWWNARVPPLTEQWWNGPIFFPAAHTLTLSDHRLGVAPLTTPLLWAGVSPLTAYNVAFLGSFVLSAMAAYAFGLALTRRFAAALLGGLVFGFNPFRAGHFPHLELLCAYWLPIALLGLHRWHQTRRAGWLALVSVALTLQAFTSAYYFAFSAVLLGLWILWFARGVGVKQLGLLVATIVIPLLIALPVIDTYRRAHHAMGLVRTLTDVEQFSADLRGLITTPQTRALWKTPLGWDRAEGALYPGLAAIAIVAIAVITRRRTTTARASRLKLVRPMLLGLAMLFAAVAALVALGGPFAYGIVGLTISASSPFKPVSLAAVCAAIWLLTSMRLREAWRAQSVFAFYVIATVAMWLFALGPTARVAGERFLYKAPYAWFMMLPGVDTAFRVPARFGMLAALTLSAAVAVAWGRVTGERRTGVVAAMTAVAAVAIVADSWTDPIELHPPPPALAMSSRVPPDAVVIELPLGTFEDAAAMHRSISHERPVVNGLSGFAPPHYQVLHAALAEGETTTLLALAERAPLAVVVDRVAAGNRLMSEIHAMPAAHHLDTLPAHDVFLIDRQPVSPPAEATAQTIDHVRCGDGSDVTRLVSDANRITGWLTATQQGTEELVGDLGRERHVSGAILAQGAWPGGFPRRLAIQTSLDAAHWSDAWAGEVGLVAVRAAMDDPREVAIPLPFEPRRARFLRLRQTGFSPLPWAVAELRVIARD